MTSPMFNRKYIDSFRVPFSIAMLVYQSVHPGRFTWNLQIAHLERKMIFQTSMIMFHVNLPGCNNFTNFFILFSPISLPPWKVRESVVLSTTWTDLAILWRAFKDSAGKGTTQKACYKLTKTTRSPKSTVSPRFVNLRLEVCFVS